MLLYVTVYVHVYNFGLSTCIHVHCRWVFQFLYLSLISQICILFVKIATSNTLSYMRSIRQIYFREINFPEIINNSIDQTTYNYYYYYRCIIIIIHYYNSCYYNFLLQRH